MKSNADIKKALAICRAGEGCKYGTNPDCPYRIKDASCDLAGLISDANKLVSDLEDTVKHNVDAMNKAAAILGCDCENCDRW